MSQQIECIWIKRTLNVSVITRWGCRSAGDLHTIPVNDQKRDCNELADGNPFSWGTLSWTCKNNTGVIILQLRVDH